MRGLRRELFRCFSCILILGSKRTNLSHKKKLFMENTYVDDARNDFLGEVSLGPICKFKKRDSVVFFNKYLTLSSRWGLN